MIDGSPIVVQFTDDIEAVIDKYRDEGLTYAEAVGVLHMLAHNLCSDARGGEESDE